jgi:hypothetical protein
MKQHQRGMRDKQKLAIQRRVLAMLDDLGNHAVTGLTVNGSESMSTLQFKSEGPRGLADTSRASPLECWFSRAWT